MLVFRETWIHKLERSFSHTKGKKEVPSIPARPTALPSRTAGTLLLRLGDSLRTFKDR